MANRLALTGAGASVSFGTTTFDQKVKSITIGGKQVEMLDATDLSVARGGAELRLAADHYTQDDVVIEFFIDPKKEQPANHNPVLVPETLTITYPKIDSASSAGATYAGSGCITRIELPTLARNEIALGRITFSPDGVTPFAHVVEA